jgi:hypothetical protein
VAGLAIAQPESELHRACGEGKIEEVRVILSRGIDNLEALGESLRVPLVPPLTRSVPRFCCNRATSRGKRLMLVLMSVRHDDRLHSDRLGYPEQPRRHCP